MFLLTVDRQDFQEKDDGRNLMFTA